MRKDHSLSNIVDDYRHIATAAALVCIGVAGLSIWVSLAYPDALQYGAIIAVACVGCTIVLLQLRYGYFTVEARVAEAAATKQIALAEANTDSLTGTYNRSYFLSLLARDVYHGSGSALGFMHIDMDHLKSINDGNGHAAGDTALVHLISTIRRIAPGAIIGRLGGDEFGIAIRGHDNKAGLRRLGDQILKAIAAPLMINGRAIRLSATIGVAVAPADASDAADLISKADLALYKGKKAGRGLTVSFEDDMLGDERHRRFVERELRAAILLNELELYYQPIFNIDGKTLKSYEALVRWQHKVRGTIAPSQFVPIAEQSDLIDKLGDWVVRRACLDLPFLDAHYVGVNVSAAQLRRSDFAQRFTAIIEETGVDPRRLIVEITETVPLLAQGAEMSNLDALRQMGVRVAIDDFGSGHASLQYLRRFAFDIIKIDRTYVANLAHKSIDAMIVGAICDIARSLPVEVVAEGVETHEQLLMLQQAGCTGLQGFLLGRPQPLRVLNAQAPAVAA